MSTATERSRHNAKHRMAKRWEPRFRKESRLVLNKMLRQSVNRVAAGQDPLPHLWQRTWFTMAKDAMHDILFAAVIDGWNLAGDEIASPVKVVTVGARDIDFLIDGDPLAVENYLFDLSSRMSAREAKQVQKLFDEWNNAYDPETGLGYTRAQIAKKIQALGWEFDKVYANLIARTATTWALNEGAIQRYKLANIAYAEWMVTLDDLTCEYCLSLDGATVKIGDPFAEGAVRGTDGGVMYVPTAINVGHPPLHPNCLLPGQTVQGKAIGALSGLYDGEAVEILTANGARLSMTINHRVLTENAMVLASDLGKGDKLIGYQSQVESSSVDINENNKPILIEEIAKSFGTSGTDVSPRCFDFNGDEKFFTSEVNVVAPKTNFIEAQINEIKRILNIAFMSSRDRGMSVNSLRDALFSAHAFPFKGLCLRTIADMNPGTFEAQSNDMTRDIERFCDTVLRLTINIPLANLIDGQSDFTTKANGFGSASECDTLLYKPTPKGFTFNTDFFTESVARFPSEISLDVITQIRRFHYSGPVYDIETLNGYYTAGSGNKQHLFVKNCRCTILPVITGF